MKNSKKTSLVLICLALCLLLAGCLNSGIEDGKVFKADKGERKDAAAIDSRLNSPGRNPFKDFDNLKAAASKIDQGMVFSISPDGKAMYYIQPAEVQKEGPGEKQRLKGAISGLMNVWRLDVASGQSRIIASQIPPVAYARWNQDGTMLALLGGNRLTIYDAARHKLLMEDYVSKRDVVYAGWSPDGRKLYTEEAALVNCDILYLDAQKVGHIYERPEKFYFKGQLDDNYYYGTRAPASEEEVRTTGYYPFTIILDREGKPVKTLSAGNFRDAYERSLLQVGSSGFALYYYPDINKPGDRKKLTEEYVYDVKFVRDGKIAFIIKDSNRESNDFLLCIADRQGREVKRHKVSGQVLILSPDGKYGRIAGLREEAVDLMKFTVSPQKQAADSYSKEEKALRAVINGAVDTYLRATGNYYAWDYQTVKKYFIDTHQPEQWAYFEVITSCREDIFPRFSKHYKSTVDLLDYKMSGDQASASVSALYTDEKGGNHMFGPAALELIKKENNWYVTGISTLPDMKIAQEMRINVDEWVKEACAGKIFKGQLQGKEVRPGQIQFWVNSCGEYILADSRYPANINCCKVYLKVKENGQEAVYKMIAERQQGSWQPTTLSRDRLSLIN